MKRILFIAAAALALTSCNFIRINKTALENLMESGAINIDADIDLASERIDASDSLVTSTYDVDPFKNIKVKFSAGIIYTQGEQALTISVPENLAEYLKVSVEDGTLNMRYSGVRIRNSKRAFITVSSPEINDITLAGAGEIRMQGPVVTDKLSIEVDGAGDVNIEDIDSDSDIDLEINGSGNIKIEKLGCRTLESEINGAGNAEFAGYAGRADLTINGAGNIFASGLEADDFHGKVNGAGKVFRK